MIDASYDLEYRIVSITDDGVVLRPINSTLSYWQEFISAKLSTGIVTPTIRLIGVPSDVQKFDAYVDYELSAPTAILQMGDTQLDISDLISYNHPNPETPGLYVIKYMVSLPGKEPSILWESYISIEESPLLRKAISPWMRDNKTIYDLNRLVLEPHLDESMYIAGIPLYNFMLSNYSDAIPVNVIGSYKSIQLYTAANGIFVSGLPLPVGTTISVKSNNVLYTIKIKGRKLAPKFNPKSEYNTGDICTLANNDWYALSKIKQVKGITPMPNTTENSNWLFGYVYETYEHYNLTDVQIEAVWAPVDVYGYQFNVELISADKLGRYLGVYNLDNFKDYGPGDIVSVCKNGVVSLYIRNSNECDESVDIAYPPGHYLNTNWKEMYVSNLDTTYRVGFLRPITNASNSVICKTYTFKDESFKLYAHLVGIPDSLIYGIGAKRSVILWAMLYRTRNTFLGLKIALEALGLKLTKLSRACPSVMYEFNNEYIDDIFVEINACKEIAKSIKANRIWDADELPPDDGIDIPWVRYTTDNNSVEVFKDGQWSAYYTFYRLNNTGFKLNNRYYRAEIGFMDRLVNDYKLDLGDDVDWIQDEGFAPISAPIADLLRYEVPIYVYLRMRVHLATIGNATRFGVIGGVTYHSNWGEPCELKLFPSKLYDTAKLSETYVYPIVSASYLGDTESFKPQYSDYGSYRIYEFIKPVKLSFEFEPGYVVTSKWVSRYSIGELTSDYYLYNGQVGLTIDVTLYPVSTTAEVLTWNYDLDGTWVLDDSTPFADWSDIQCKIYVSTPMTDWTNAIAKVYSPNVPLQWVIEDGYLYVSGGLPPQLYVYNDNNMLICRISLKYPTNSVGGDNMGVKIKL